VGDIGLDDYGTYEAVLWQRIDAVHIDDNVTVKRVVLLQPTKCGKDRCTTNPKLRVAACFISPLPSALDDNHTSLVREAR
jgi:hypothetical protein